MRSKAVRAAVKAMVPARCLPLPVWLAVRARVSERLRAADGCCCACCRPRLSPSENSRFANAFTRLLVWPHTYGRHKQRVMVGRLQ